MPVSTLQGVNISSSGSVHSTGKDTTAGIFRLSASRFRVSIPGRVQYVSAIFPTGNLVVTHESQEAEVATSDHPAQVCYLGACD